jgi:hypothetical protein
MARKKPESPDAKSAEHEGKAWKEAKATILGIMPRRFVVALAVTAFVLAVVLLGAGLLWPERFESPPSRFILCIFVALNLAVFFFIIYPEEFKISEVPIINVAVPLVGPIVLFIVILLLMWKMMPEPALASRFFVPYERGEQAARISFENVTLSPSEEDFRYYVVPTKDGFLAGIYVEFAGGKGLYKARFRAPFYKQADITFERGPGPGRFEVERH